MPIKLNLDKSSGLLDFVSYDKKQSHAQAFIL